MSATYPNPCTHCGACCIFAQCPASIAVHGKLAAAVMLASEEIEGRPATREDYEWTLEFMRMANNPEGFASDYCEQYL